MLPPRPAHGFQTPYANPLWPGPSLSRVPPPEDLGPVVDASPGWWRVKRPIMMSPRRRLSFDASRLSLIEGGGATPFGRAQPRHTLTVLVLLTLIFLMLGTVLGFLVTYTRSQRTYHVEDGETAMEYKTEPHLVIDDYGPGVSYWRREKKSHSRHGDVSMGVNSRGLLSAHSAHGNATTLRVTRANVQAAMVRFAHDDDQAWEDPGSTTGGEAAFDTKTRISAEWRSLLRPGAQAKGADLDSRGLGADVKIATASHAEVTSGTRGTVAAA